jgi:hypothetical protein
MASYYVLTPPAMTNAEKQTLFIRDGFSWPAFLFPLPWLLVRKLWLLAGLSVVLFLAAVLIAEYWGLDGLPLAYTVILCLWTGLEGGHVRASSLQHRGWDLKASIAADNLDEAEAVYFDGVTETAAPAPRMLRVHQASHPSNAVALGLIGPYGSR